MSSDSHPVIRRFPTCEFLWIFSRSSALFLSVPTVRILRFSTLLIGNVGVFFFEDFVTNYESFMTSLYRFVGVNDQFLPPNAVIWRGPNKLNATLLRWLNTLSTTKHRQGLLPYDFYIWYRQWFEKHVLPSKLFLAWPACLTSLMPILVLTEYWSLSPQLRHDRSADLVESLFLCQRPITILGKFSCFPHGTNIRRLAAFSS